MWRDDKTGMVAVKDNENGKILWRSPVDAREMSKQEDKRYSYAVNLKTLQKRRAPVAPPPEEDEDETGNPINSYNFSKHTKLELQAFCDQAGIPEEKIAGAKTKADLVELLGQTEFNPGAFVDPSDDDDSDDEDDDD